MRQEGERLTVTEAESSQAWPHPLECPCCGLEIDAEDVDLAVEESGTFDGYCRDCEPGHCPACDGDLSADETPLGKGRRLT